MSQRTDYIEVNKKLWNEKTPWHVHSSFYDLDGFKAGKNTLTEIELPLLGDVKGKKLLHLQCHFGLDSLSLARMGAQVTGIDFSDKAIAQAQALAAELGLDARFICSNVYDLKEKLAEKFDLVFSSYGVIGWLPDMEAWASVVAHFLKPGGSFVFAEFHPVVWMFDNEFIHIAYSYFKTEPVVEEEAGTYADKKAPGKLESISWNHSLHEVLGALLRLKLRLMQFEEFDYSPFNCFANTIETEPGKFKIQNLSGMLPMVYALKAVKEAE